MSQLAQIAHTLNHLADEKQTTPDDVLKAATERGDPFEKIVEELDAHTRRALADAKECADVVAAAQRLKEVTVLRAAMFKESFLTVIQQQYHAVAAEYDALIKARGAEYEALLAASHAEIESLSREKSARLQGLLSHVDAVGFVTHRSDLFFAQRQIDYLKTWTGKTHSSVIYDSAVDEFTCDGLFSSVKGKPNVAIIGFTTDGDVFGGCYSLPVGQGFESFNDPDIFVFSFESHRRCMKPQMFVSKEELKERAGVFFWNGHFCGFVQFNVCDGGCFWLGNESSQSYCENLSKGFEGLEDTTLTGQNNTDRRNPPYHHCTRLVAVHLS